MNKKISEKRLFSQKTSKNAKKRRKNPKKKLPLKFTGNFE